MASYAGWIRVVSGVRLVASAAVQQASAEAGSVATRTAQHGLDMAANLRSAAALPSMPPQQQPHQLLVAW